MQNFNLKNMCGKTRGIQFDIIPVVKPVINLVGKQIMYPYIDSSLDAEQFFRDFNKTGLSIGCVEIDNTPDNIWAIVGRLYITQDFIIIGPGKIYIEGAL